MAQVRLRRINARRVWEECSELSRRAYERLSGSGTAPRHAISAASRRGQVRWALGVLAAILAAVALGSSSLPTAHHTVASRTFTPSAWPGLTRKLPEAAAPGTVATAANESAPAAPAACSAQGASAAPATTSATTPAPGSTTSAATPAGTTSYVRQSASSDPSAGTKAPPKVVLAVATTSAASAPTTGDSHSAVLDGTLTPSSSTSSTTSTTSTTTTTVPASKSATTSNPLHGVLSDPTGAISGAAAGAAAALQKTLQDLLAAGGVTSSSQPGSSSALQPLPPLGQSPGSSSSPPGSSAAGASGASSSQAVAQQGAAVAGLSPADLEDSPFAPSMSMGCELLGSDQVGTLVTGESATQGFVVNAATRLLGTPYVWGGESTNGFDCSGLVQYVFNEAGVHLPRVAQDQYDAGPSVAPGSPVVPGDLVFFGSSPSSVEHVGIFAGNGLMIDAPYTGAVVRFDRVGGSLPIVGITSPGGQ